jgi:hypothetical protein
MGDIRGTFIPFPIIPFGLDLQADATDPFTHDVLGMGACITVNNGPYLFISSAVFDTDRRFELPLL